MTSKFIGLVVLGLGVIVSACAPATGTTSSASNAGTRGTPKRVVAAIMAGPPVMARVLTPGSHWRGIEHLQALPAGGPTGSGAGSRDRELAAAATAPRQGQRK